MHLALDDEPGAEAPEEWLIHRICEEFHCLPSAAVMELRHGPWPLLYDVMDVRAYARTKAIIEEIDKSEKKSADDYPDGPMTDAVLDNEARIMRAKMEERSKSRKKKVSK